MAIPSWPNGLPSRPLRSGFSEPEHNAPPLATTVEEGPEILRARSNTRIERKVYPLYFTHVQYATFKAFVLTTLGQATAQFTMPVFSAPDVFETRRVYIEGGKWGPVEPYRLGWIVRPVLCVFPAS